MKVSVLQENLAKALSIVHRAVPSRPTLPVLNNVLVSTEDQRLKLAATNLDLGITCWIGAKVNEDGATTVPARTLLDLVNNLSPERVDLELNPRNQMLNLRCGGTTANIKCVDASEYPLIPEADTERGVTIPAEVFREMVSHVDFAAAKEDNRPVLTGIFTRFEDNLLTMAAADGYRLALRTAFLEVPVATPTEIIIPARALTEVARIISEEDKHILVSLPEGRNQVMFHLTNVDVVASLIEGNFPDYEAIIPRSHTTTTQVYTNELLRACKRSEVFAKDSANAARIMIKPSASGPGRVMVASRSQEKGDNEGLVDASVDGEEIEISFNIRYLLDVLAVIKEDQVVIETSGPAAPGVVRPAERDDFVHVIMPMSVNS
ncbi:MAG: DNA polymerase III subunit beta [Anaerolineae bacterium]|nr:DNA polymerase III subunit beta [Anaerolineae bacterium]